MRNIEVIIAFINRDKAKSSTGSLWSTGDCLYTYSTCLAEFDKHGNLYVNTTRYSTTSSHHRNLLIWHLSNMAFAEVHDVPRCKIHLIPKDERIY